MNTRAVRTVLVLGATGFIGSYVSRALRRAGFDVVQGVRSKGRASGCRSVEIDYRRDDHAEHWLPALRGIDAVVNAVGILRESGGLTFDAVHVKAPVALFEACVQGGVEKIIQISALGADADARSRYHITKKQADDALSALPVRWTILQPSLVFGPGGTSAALFTMLASLPVIPLPGSGNQQVQPVHIEDFADAVVKVLESEDADGRRIAAVGPRALTLRQFLQALRRSMHLRPAAVLPIPLSLVRVAAIAGDHVPGVLLDRETLGMLLRGNTGSAGDISALLGRAPRPVESFIPATHARSMATVARLGWLKPLLRISIAVVWIVTGVLSLGVYPVSESYALLSHAGLTGAAATVALYGAAALDLLFGIATLLVRRRRPLYQAQIVLIVIYTAIITLRLPEFWLHPYGPVLKNIPLLAGLVLLHELETPEYET